uniref:BING4 C-terminal domain-containing protein n=1 Tax=Percolomonas cosmopolitus TaxID=63605 RepID=A0A7S1KU38_9EUKA
MSSLLPSSTQKKSHPLSNLLTQEDYDLAQQSRQKDEQRENEYDQEIKRRTIENRRIMKELVPVGVDKENKHLKERKKRIERDVLKRYERDTSGTRVKTRDEIKWQLRRKKKNRDLDVNTLRWQEENRKRQLLELAENDIVRANVSIPKGVELDHEDYQASTQDLTQQDMLQEADLNTKAKVFHLNLPFSASGYNITYNTSGRHILISSSSGYVASVQWKNFQLIHELSLGTHIGDTVWMMDDTMYTLSSSKTPIVYNDQGEQIHRMREFIGCSFMQYLQYHFTVVGGNPGRGLVIYKDISIGDEAIKVQVKPITSMCQNPHNAIIICGHADGQISMVTPRDKPMEPVVSMLCHKSPVQRIAVDLTGTYMVTCSKEGVTKVWEIKKSFKQIARYRSPAGVSGIAISQNGMLALGIRNQVLIWKHPSELSKKKIYLKHTLSGRGLVTSLKFCPYEDILGVGRSNGVSHVLVPGSGMSEFDTRTANPLSTDATTKNLNVDMLLEKIPLDMISLDPDVVGTSGVKQQAYTFDNHVKLDDTLKEELQSLGIREQEERKKLRDMSREELRAEKEKQDKEFKSGLQEWYEDEAPNPLDRFASRGKRKHILMEKGEIKGVEEEGPAKKKAKVADSEEQQEGDKVLEDEDEMIDGVHMEDKEDDDVVEDDGEEYDVDGETAMRFLQDAEEGNDDEDVFRVTAAMMDENHIPDDSDDDSSEGNDSDDSSDDEQKGRSTEARMSAFSADTIDASDDSEDESDSSSSDESEDSAEEKQMLMKYALQDSDSDE